LLIAAKELQHAPCSMLQAITGCLLRSTMCVQGCSVEA